MKYNKMLSVITLLLLIVVGCKKFSGEYLVLNSQQQEEARTAPSLEIEIQKMYKKSAGASASGNLRIASHTSTSESSVPSGDEVEHMVEKYRKNTENFQKVSAAMTDDDSVTVTNWESEATYATLGTKVKYAENNKIGIFVNKWWTKGNKPIFSAGGPWHLIKRINADGATLAIKDVVEGWGKDTIYTGGSLVKYSISNTEYCFEAKYWTKENQPILTGEGTGKKSWESPWKRDDEACKSEEPAVSSIQIGGGKPAIEQPPAIKTPSIPASAIQVSTTPVGTPIVPPVIPKPPAPERVPPKAPAMDLVESTVLPNGYAFLKEVTTEHWDWMFPLRSGKYNPGGSYRNQAPIANPDGSKDTFNLDNFKRAVLSYNNWAKAKGYKQFLNEGTKKQQAQEFLVFWAKSSRETSGTWTGAKSPWIESYQGKDVWKGGLYWVEEVGYTTNSDGTSSSINYVDAASKYTPVPGRSYYGRGVIQLSWNYNYGAFSEWLYNNGMLSDLIVARDTLLKRPDYVATRGDLSILSGIWFWMTPQGTKPSSHDVLYGDVYNVSANSWDRGLPPRNDGGEIPVAAGDTTDESIMAYRLGTIINIVNGGIECNKAAKYHTGPPQRVSYFNAYTMYFNDQMPGLNATRITKATNIWAKKITPGDNDDIKNATCYSQKSYYGW